MTRNFINETPICRGRGDESPLWPDRAVGSKDSSPRLLQIVLTTPIKMHAIVATLLLFWAGALSHAQSTDADFARVAKIFAEHCLDCHAVQDPEGKLVLETYDLLMKGGESGPAIIPDRSGESLLVKMIEGKFQKDGKTKVMPPGKREKLNKDQIALIRAWINAGAKPPADGAVVAKEIVVPKIAPKVQPRRAITAIAYEPKSKLLALARIGEVEIYSAESQSLIRTFEWP